MKWFINLKIAAKLIISFVIMAVIAGVVGVFGIINITNISNADTVLYEKNVLGIESLSEAAIDFQKARFYVIKMELVKNDTQREECIKNVTDYFAKADESFKKYDAGIILDYDREKFNELMSLWNSYKAIIQNVLKLIKEGKIEQADALIEGEAGASGNSLQECFDTLIKMNSDGAKTRVDDNSQMAWSGTIVMLVVVFAGIVIAIILGIFISKIISKPINKMVGAADKIADGDTNVNIDVTSKDEIGILANAYNRIISSIKTTMAETRKLNQAASDGMLSVRGDAAKLKGGYADIVKGINDTLDSITAPLHDSVQIMNKMSLNDYTSKMAGQYKGEFKEFAETINLVIARLISVQDALERLGKGDLSRLEEFEKVGKRSENDRLVPSMVSGLKAVHGIINEVGTLTNATLNGNLSLRGNEDKFEGGYREIIQGFNDTIDAVVKPINEASDVLQEMSNANLTVSMKGEYKGEYAKIKEAINHTSDAFNQMLNEINSAAQQVASGSKQISDSSVALSQGATEQASSIEELTASLEEISSQTKLNAGNANKANELAGNAKSNAVHGNTQMKEMLKAMDEINVSSSNIYKIIKVIDDIAFQTNILALNAAVEAARAGQHGKGFAVVAEEVRTLAARSANAAKETTELIEGSIKKVEAGTKIANDTAEALDKIVDEVEKAANLVSDIAIASNEQATGIDQINQGIMQVSQVVQTNSATSEEGAAASEELSSQAEILKEMVGKVKLKKVSQTYNKLEELDPEVMKMIESMYKKKYDGSKSEEDKGEASAAKNAKGKKIYLSENDFGKY